MYIIPKRTISLHHDKFPALLKYINNNISRLKSQDSTFQKIAINIHELNNGVKEFNELQELSKTLEYGSLAKKDLEKLEPQLNAHIEAIESHLVASLHNYDDSDAILEVVPGAGGLEACLFAEEIYNLYSNYMKNHWGFKVLEKEIIRPNGICSRDNKSGITKAVCKIMGVNVFKILKFEVGVHRVQRVPITGSKNDRLQTSTCSIAILPEPRAQSTPISEKDCKFEFMRSSGPGGQSVNTTDSSVRVTHLPSGTIVECQEQRTALANKAIALAKLQTLLFVKEFEKESQMTKTSRKSQIGKMDRNEKIRTYNYPRNSLTDHRIKDSTTNVVSMTSFMKGYSGFSPLADYYAQLSKREKEEHLISLIELSENEKS